MLRDLAAQRAARRRAQPLPPSAEQAKPVTTSASRAPSAFCSLEAAHRSVRLAHSLGLCVALLGLLLPGLLLRSATWTAVLVGSGLVLARSGAVWLHGVLPQMLREGTPPPPSLKVTDGVLASPYALLDSDAWAVEREVALENLAYICTYGKKNCLTSQMYSGPLTLGKVSSLVWNKLSEGVIRC